MNYLLVGILFFSMPIVIGICLSLYITKIKANIYANAFKSVNENTNKKEIKKNQHSDIIINVIAFFVSLILVFAFLDFCIF